MTANAKNNARAQNDDHEEGEVVEIDGAAGKRLKSLIERIERLEQEKADLATDIKDIYGEAKSVGFDPKIIRKLIRLRKMEEAARNEEDMLLETYKAAIGMA